MTETYYVVEGGKRADNNPPNTPSPKSFTVRFRRKVNKYEMEDSGIQTSKK